MYMDDASARTGPRRLPLGNIGFGLHAAPVRPLARTHFLCDSPVDVSAQPVLDPVRARPIAAVGPDTRGALRLLARKPMFFLLVMGCAISMLASGRFTPRLILDGAISFAFVPIFTLAAFWLVWARSPRRMPFTIAADRFYAGNSAWLLWTLAGAAVGVFVSPRATWPWMVSLAFAGIFVAVWTLVVDYRFFRRGMGRAPVAATVDLIVQRALSWGAICTYFFGAAFVPDVLPHLLEWMGL